MDSSYKLMVKFKAEEIARIEGGKLFFSNPQKVIATASSVLNFTYSHVIRDLAETGEIICTENNIDFSQYKGLVYVTNCEAFGIDALERIAAMFNALDIVEYVELEALEPPPPPGAMQAAEGSETYISIDRPTADFSHYQTYLGAQNATNPAIWGVDVHHAWSLGARGQGIRCADIEWGFIYDHEDLHSPNFIELVRTINHTYDDHGAAVVGVLFAHHNHVGMQGATPDLDRMYGVSELPHGRVDGIARGLRQLRAGDVFIYEMQTGGQNGELVPPDFNRAVWDITLAATRAGIIVVCTAGNGNANLDHPFYNEYRNRGDNGIIMVGAGTRDGRHRAEFSTFGSPVHVQGWGGDVATTGYGDLFDEGRLRTYTRTFNGTSSAAPIVAAAVIAIQSWYKAKHNGALLSPIAMRDLLIRTGTPQGTRLQGHIGPLPNIRNAIHALSTNPGPEPDNPNIHVIDSMEHLRPLADPNRTAALLQQNQEIRIIWTSGMWEEPRPLVFPSAPTIPAGRIISLTNQLPWNVLLQINGQPRLLGQNVTERYVVQGSSWSLMSAM